jgi:hypothetical protein
VGQSSSQHDKFQVGDIHAYILDLVHFPSFHRHSLTHSVVLRTFMYLYLYLYLLVHVPVLVCIPVYILILVPMPVLS